MKSSQLLAAATDEDAENVHISASAVMNGHDDKSFRSVCVCLYLSICLSIPL